MTAIEQRTEADTLFDTIKEWAAHQNDWTVTLEKIEFRLPQSRDTIDLSNLHLQTPQGKVHFEPQGRDRNGKYIVKMYAYPTLVRVYLLYKSGLDWEVVTDAMLPFHMKWNEANFVRLVHDLQELP